MIFPVTGIPADPPDDTTTASDDASPGNQYLSKKDFRRILLGLLLLALVLAPIIKKSYDDRLRYDCGQNFRAMSLALHAYMAENDDQFPPTYKPDENSGKPYYDAKGRPYTWASVLVNVAGFDTKHKFTCPAATPDELMVAEGYGDDDLPMSYGMYAPYSTQKSTSSSDAGSAVIIAETSSGGANGTFDPDPMAASLGKVRDGFLIGFSSGDAIPDAKFPPEPSVTRLAVPGSAKGLNGKLTQGRHDNEIFVMFADGHYRLMKVSALASQRYWAIPGH